MIFGNQAVVIPVFRANSIVLAITTLVTIILSLISIIGCSSRTLSYLAMIRVDLTNANLTNLLSNETHDFSNISDYNYFGLGGVCFGNNDQGSIVMSSCSTKYRAIEGFEFTDAIFNGYDLKNVNTSFPLLFDNDFKGYDNTFKVVFKLILASLILLWFSLLLYIVNIIKPNYTVFYIIRNILIVAEAFMMIGASVTLHFNNLEIKRHFTDTYSQFGIKGKLPPTLFILLYITTGILVISAIWETIFKKVWLHDLIMKLGGPPPYRVFFDTTDGIETRDTYFPSQYYSRPDYLREERRDLSTGETFVVRRRPEVVPRSYIFNHHGANIEMTAERINHPQTTERSEGPASYSIAIHYRPVNPNTTDFQPVTAIIQSPSNSNPTNSQPNSQQDTSVLQPPLEPPPRYRSPGIMDYNPEGYSRL